MTLRTVEAIESRGYKAYDYTTVTGEAYVVWLSSVKQYYAVHNSTAQGLPNNETEVNTQPVVFTDELQHSRFEHWLRAMGATEPTITAPLARPRVRNNDGRVTCALCDAPTRTIALFMSSAQICTKCGF